MAIVGDTWGGSRGSQGSEVRKRGSQTPVYILSVLFINEKGQYDNQVLVVDIVRLTDYAL